MKVEKLVIKNIGPFHGTHRINFTTLGDIFLIYGKTGAGKTTVFDAITYALYGNISGGRKDLVKQMRSHFAGPGDECAVELTFSLGRKRYRVCRSLPGEKIGKRSGKITDSPEQVTLEEESGSTWENRTSSKKSETDGMIFALLGLSLEEFSRIILLPQGEFSQFLRLNSKDRKEVLLKLFPMETCTRIIEEARDRSRDAAGRLKDKEATLTSLRQEYDSDTYDENRKVLTAAIADLEKKHTVLLASYQTQSRVCEQAQAIAKKRRRQEELNKALTALDAEKEAISRKKHELALARKAAPLVYRIEQLTAAETDREQIARELDATIGELSAAIDARAAFEKASGDHTRNEEKQQELRARRQSLDIAVGIAETLVQEQEELAGLKKRRSELQKATGETGKKLSGFDTRLDELAEPVSRLEDRTRGKEEADKRLQKARIIHECATEYERIHRAMSAHAGAAANMEKRIGEAEKDLAITRAELEDLLGEQERTRTENAAAAIAQTLTEGKPCPVCGSTEHPHPAARTAAFDTVGRIDAKNRTIQALEAGLDKMRKEHAACRANEEAAAERLAETCNKNPELFDRDKPEDIPTPEEAAKELEQAAHEMETAANELTLSQKAVREAEDIRKNRVQFLAGTEKTAAELDTLVHTITEKETGITFNTNRYREAFPDETVPDPAMTEEALEVLDATLLELDAALRKFTEGFASAKEQCVSLTARKEQQEKLLLGKQKDIASIQKELADQCTKAGFPDAAAIRAAARNEEQMDELDRYILEWNKRLTETSAEAERLAGELQDWTGPDPETAETELQRISGELKASDTGVHEKKLALSNLDMREQQYQSLVAEFEDLSKEAGTLVALAGDLTGQNPAKLSFDAWILGTYLDEITAYANTRLERMSDGRFRIQVDDQYRKGNSLAGLDLEILDAYTGKARPAATLSGGETFMASISLALGLADSIQARSGGIQLDAVFIDEGFGSLDETSLEKALGILDEIRGHRMVGLISHVPELRSRIPGRIEIVKTQTGSRIEQGELS